MLKRDLVRDVVGKNSWKVEKLEIFGKSEMLLSSWTVLNEIEKVNESQGSKSLSIIWMYSKKCSPHGIGPIYENTFYEKTLFMKITRFYEKLHMFQKNEPFLVRLFSST